MLTLELWSKICHLTQSKYTDTRPTISVNDLTTAPGRVAIRAVTVT